MLAGAAGHGILQPGLCVLVHTEEVPHMFCDLIQTQMLCALLHAAYTIVHAEDR